VEYERTGGESFEEELAKIGGGGTDTNKTITTTTTATANTGDEQVQANEETNDESSAGTIRKCKRPWWVAQPIIRPLPSEALAKGALTMSKKDKAKQQQQQRQQQGAGTEAAKKDGAAAAEHAAEAQAQDSGKEEELKSRDALVAG
jgi:tRNA-dihydrouridine synthase 1